MSDARASAGLAARLLDRADGGVSTLRPHIVQTFAAEQARAAPILERTEEIAVSPRASPPLRDAPAAAPPAAAVPVASSAPQRLMPPPAPPAPRAVARAGETATESPPAAPTLTAAPAAPAAPIAQPAAGPAPDPVSPPLRGARRAQHHPRQADSLSAAVMQLLAPAPAAPAAAREAAPGFSRRDAQMPSDRPAVPAIPAPMPGSARAASEPGLTIHIGEIVVAPEPRTAGRKATPRPAWQPPMSLAEYRATRARERR